MCWSKIWVYLEGFGDSHLKKLKNKATDEKSVLLMFFCHCLEAYNLHTKPYFPNQTTNQSAELPKKEIMAIVIRSPQTYHFPHGKIWNFNLPALWRETVQWLINPLIQGRLFPGGVVRYRGGVGWPVTKGPQNEPPGEALVEVDLR